MMIGYGENSEAAVCTFDEILNAIIDAEKRTELFHPILFLLQRGGDGPSLGLGIGPNGFMLTWTGENGDPPYYISKNDRSRDMTAVTFFFMNSPSEYHMANLVDRSQFVSAVQQFIVDGSRTEALIWEEV